MNLRLTDKAALVSGSTKGIGSAIAIGLAREGARVIVNGRSEKTVAEAKNRIFEPRSFGGITDDEWRRFFEVNVLSGVRSSRAYLLGMKERNRGAHRAR
jgi:NAD(P)-dependent dehydrogenase (short-subunit alcohol dehydrogenase family)